MSDLSHVKSLIFVFALPGCHACHDYLPRLEQHVTRFKQHGVPLTYYTGKAIPPGQIPIIVADSSSTDPQIQNLLDQYKIDAMPTTVLITHNAKPAVLIGAIDDAEIHELLSSAAIASQR